MDGPSSRAGIKVLIRYPLAIAPINGDDYTKAFRLASRAGDEKDSTDRRHNGLKDGNLGIHRGVVVVTRDSLGRHGARAWQPGWPP